MSCEGLEASEHRDCEAEKDLAQNPNKGGPYQSQRMPAKACLAPLDMVKLSDLDDKRSTKNIVSDR